MQPLLVSVTYTGRPAAKTVWVLGPPPWFSFLVPAFLFFIQRRNRDLDGGQPSG
jgi:hypothetical protein